VRGLTGSARGVAMVFQSYALFPHLSVADNITFGLSVRTSAVCRRSVIEISGETGAPVRIKLRTRMLLKLQSNSKGPG